MKSTLLLATGLFLISAPAPDSELIAEITANFMGAGETSALLASDRRFTRAVPGRTISDASLPAAPAEPASPDPSQEGPES